MAMSNEEVISLLGDFERLSKLDPKLRKVVTDRAIKAIKASEKAVADEAETERSRQRLTKKYADLINLENRVNTNLNLDIKNDINPPSVLFYKNVVVSLCDIHQDDFSNPLWSLERIADVYLETLKAVCRFQSGGFLCPYCTIEKCKVRSKMTAEEVEKRLEDALSKEKDIVPPPGAEDHPLVKATEEEKPVEDHSPENSKTPWWRRKKK